MNLTVSLTDKAGVTVSLSASIPTSSHTPLFAGLLSGSADEDLVESSFYQVLPRLSTQLQQAHLEVVQALLESYSQSVTDGFSSREADQEEGEEK